MLDIMSQGPPGMGMNQENIFNLVCGVLNSCTTNSHQFLGAKETAFVHEVCDAVEQPSGMLESPNS